MRAGARPLPRTAVDYLSTRPLFDQGGRNRNFSHPPVSHRSVVVTGVDASSDLAAAGLAANDVILSVDGEEIGSVDDLRKISALGKPFTVGISRAQNPITLKSK